MTEKRFTYKHFDWLQWHIYKDGEFFIEVTNCEEDAKMLCELLNELDSENTELKKVLQYETQMHRKWKTECTNEIKENNKIKNTINEMYNNERTYIGKSTLKQLLEQIQ
jgi:hypothetical protein